MYFEEILDSNGDDGTMPDNVDTLRDAVIGHRIVSAHQNRDGSAFIITLDNGTSVQLHDVEDCCAYTELRDFLLHPELVDHVITGVGTTGGYTTWHIYADMGDVLQLDVGWSCGNPFFYGYGFCISIVE